MSATTGPRTLENERERAAPEELPVQPPHAWDDAVARRLGAHGQAALGARRRRLGHHGNRTERQPEQQSGTDNLAHGRTLSWGAVIIAQRGRGVCRF